MPRLQAWRSQLQWLDVKTGLSLGCICFCIAGMLPCEGNSCRAVLEHSTFPSVSTEGFKGEGSLFISEGRDLEKSLGCFSSRKPIKARSSLENLHLLLPPRPQDGLWRPASGLEALQGLLFICFALDQEPCRERVRCQTAKMDERESEGLLYVQGNRDLGEKRQEGTQEGNQHFLSSCPRGVRVQCIRRRN